MNSRQEKTLFESYQWEYNYITRTWVAPNGREIAIDQLIENTGDSDGDLALMALIVENGVRQLS